MLLKIEKHWFLVASLVYLLFLVPCPPLAMIAVGMDGCGNTGGKEKHLNLRDETVVTAGIVGSVCRTFCMLYGLLDVTVG